MRAAEGRQAREAAGDRGRARPSRQLNAASNSSNSSNMLSPSEQQIVQAGWAEAKRDKKALGVQVFLTMFDLFPHHQEMFSNFRGKTRQELAKCPQLKAHGLRVVNTLDGAIQSLDDMELCGQTLELIGSSHKVHRLRCSHFEDLNRALRVVLENKLGKDYTNHEDTWEKLLDNVIPIIQRGLSS